MKTIVITMCRGKLTAAVFEDGLCRMLVPEPEEETLVGNIYTGRVTHILHNIDAAFIEFLPGKNGYYSLKDHPLLRLREGDEIAVQVSRDAVKTKEPVLTSNLSFAGRYTVVTTGNRRVSVSSKIRSADERNRLKELLSGCAGEDFGLIARTGAENVPSEDILKEVSALREKAEDILARAGSRKPHTLLYSAEPGYVRIIRDHLRDTERIVTDLPECRDMVRQFLMSEAPECLSLLTFYSDDSCSLDRVYRIDRTVGEALDRKVWLKSGGYLVIEPTEALTVIDVNSGKYSDRKSPDDTVLKINLEAARESARQLTLRNISGMILIDFINMRRQEDTVRLLEELQAELRKDPVKTVLVDVTALGLAEITRKKIRRPISEIF